MGMQGIGASRQWTRNQWMTLAGGSTALLVGPTAVSLTLSVYLLPIGEAFGWGRDIFSAAVAMTMFAGAFATPFIGQIVDRFSPRGTIIVGALLTSIVLASLSLLTDSKALLYVQFALLGLACSAHGPVSYIKIITSWIDEGRGLAIGLTLLGAAIGATLMPIFAQFVISNEGWRAGFLAMGVLIAIVALPAQVFLIKWPPPALPQTVAGPASANGKDKAAQGGETSAPRVFRALSFWIIVLPLFMMGNVLTGLMVHFVALMHDLGFGPTTAPLMISIAGLAMVAGRLIAGLSLDVFRTDLVAVVFFGAPALAILLLLLPTGTAGAVVAAIIIGICSGGETEVAAVLVLKLFDKARFGKIYSWAIFGFTIGSGAGPWLLGSSFKASGSYTDGLIILIILSLTAMSFAFLIGRQLAKAALRTADGIA